METQLLKVIVTTLFTYLIIVCYWTSCLRGNICLWGVCADAKQLSSINTVLRCPYSPADEGGDDDAPGRAAAVRVGRVLAFAAPAAQEDGVEEEEEEVQGQTGQRHASQQQDRLAGQSRWGGGFRNIMQL